MGVIILGYVRLDPLTTVPNFMLTIVLHMCVSCVRSDWTLLPTVPASFMYFFPKSLIVSV